MIRILDPWSGMEKFASGMKIPDPQHWFFKTKIINFLFFFIAGLRWACTCTLPGWSAPPRCRTPWSSGLTRSSPPTTMCTLSPWTTSSSGCSSRLPPGLKLMIDWSAVYRNLICWFFTQAFFITFFESYGPIQTSFIQKYQEESEVGIQCFLDPWIRESGW